MVPFDVYGAILNNRRLVPRPSQQLRSLAWTATPTAAPPPYLIALSIRLEIARRNASGRAKIVVPVHRRRSLCRRRRKPPRRPLRPRGR